MQATANKPVFEALNSSYMKIIKWISILVVGSLLALILCLEAYYLYAASKLDLNEVTSDSVYSQKVYDSLWASLGETGEIELEATSATGFVLSVFSYGFSDLPRQYSGYFSKGSITSNQAARLFMLKKRQRTIDRHVSSVVTAIWLSRNSEVNHLLGYLIEKSFFGKRAYGLESASNYYFNKKPSDLKLNEVVSLVSLLKAPSRYNPYCKSERFRERAEFVYSQLQQNWPDKYGGQSFRLPQLIERKDSECK